LERNDNEIEVVRTPIVEMEISPTDMGKLVSKMDETYKEIMTKDTDYGTIPGTTKPTLYKSGAEMLCVVFNLRREMTIIQSVANNGNEELHEDPFFEYTIQCTLWSRKYGIKMGDGMGNCNTGETRYCKRKDGSKITRDQIFTLKNTVLKMAEKRAFVDATLSVTGASRIFTQDVEDLRKANLLDDEGTKIDTPKPKMSTEKKIPNYTPFKSKDEKKEVTTEKIDTPKPEVYTTPSIPNEGMNFELRWNVDGIQSPFKPNDESQVKLVSWMRGQMNLLAKEGVQFQEVIVEGELMTLYCNGLNEKQLAVMDKAIRWTYSTIYKIAKEKLEIEVVPLE